MMSCEGVQDDGRWQGMSRLGRKLIALILTRVLVVGLTELAVRGWMVRAKTRPGRSCRAAVSGAAGLTKPLGVHVVRSVWACM